MINPSKLVRSDWKLFPPSSCPYQLSFAEWTSRWWRWLLSIPKNISPVNDITGEFTKQSQYDPNVWFLAGTFGGSTERKCIIPFGKSILFPVINYEASFADEPLLSDALELENKCKEEIDKIGELYCHVDGQVVDLREYRIASSAFEITLSCENCLSAKAGKTVMASDGYWLFLSPLPQGKHEIKSFGSCLAGKIKIGCTFDINII